MRENIVHRDPVTSSVTLIRTNVNVIVDTGGRGDTQLILDKLKKEGLSPEQIDYVINTHWHPDHTSNNHLFQNAKIIMGGSTWPPGVDEMYGSWKEEIDGIEGVDIIRTPGHTLSHISVLVDADKKYILTGDAFFEEDLRKGANPKAYEDFDQFKKNVLTIIENAEVLIPGHGDILEFDDNLREELLDLAKRI